MPLILDASEDGRVRAYYEYKGSVADCVELCRSPAIGGMPAKAAMEEIRKRIVAAAQNGNVLVFSCGTSKIKWLKRYEPHPSCTNLPSAH